MNLLIERSFVLGTTWLSLKLYGYTSRTSKSLLIQFLVQLISSVGVDNLGVTTAHVLLTTMEITLFINKPHAKYKIKFLLLLLLNFVTYLGILKQKTIQNLICLILVNR